MNITINKFENTSITYKQLIDLIHLAFTERCEQGLNFTCSSMNEDDYRSKTKNSVLFVATEINTEVLLGTVSLSILEDHRGIVYGYLEYLAVAPFVKRIGLASKLLNQLVATLVDAGGQYVISDTAVPACSSVKWHRKNGFRIVALQSYSSTNYYSYIFRKQLAHPSIWDYAIICRMAYFRSFLKIRMTKRKDGNLTKLGRFFAKM